MGYWKTKVLPKIKKVFDKNGPKKAAAAEAVKSFDESKDEINKQFEEKKEELQPKALEIYEASSTEIKSLIKERKESGLKKNSAAVHKFFEELVKIEFPGSKQVTEASSKYGAVMVSGPVFFVLEKFSTFVVTEEVKTDKEEEEKEAPKTTTDEAASSKEREIVVEEEKKEETAVPEKVAEESSTVEDVKKAEEEPPKATEEAEAAPAKAEEAPKP